VVAPAAEWVNLFYQVKNRISMGLSENPIR
jgi:hypothetical protein